MECIASSDWFCQTFSDAPVEVVAVSPVGALFAVALRNGLVHVFEVAGRCRDRTIDEAAGVGSLSFSPDGNFLAVGTHDGSVHIVDVWAGLDVRVALPGAEGKAVTKLRMLEGAASAIAICDNGDAFQVTSGAIAGKPWTATLLRRLPHDTKLCAISPTGSILVGDELPVFSDGLVAVSDDGLFVASTGPRTLQVTSRDGTRFTETMPEESTPTALAVSNDGQFVARASAAEPLVLWKTEDHTRLDVGNWFPKNASQVLFSDGGRWMVAVWKTHNVSAWQLRPPPVAPRELTPDERIAALEARVAAVEARLTHE